MNDDTKLIFIYNADSSIIAEIGSFLVKTFMPKKYDCNLCMITHGKPKTKKEWKRFLNLLPQEKTFLHRDEFVKKYPKFKNVDLPSIFLKSEENMYELVTAEDINQKKSVTELSLLIKEKLNREYENESTI